MQKFTKLHAFWLIILLFTLGFGSLYAEEHFPGDEGTPTDTDPGDYDTYHTDGFELRFFKPGTTLTGAYSGYGEATCVDPGSSFREDVIKATHYAGQFGTGTPRIVNFGAYNIVGSVNGYSLGSTIAIHPCKVSHALEHSAVHRVGSNDAAVYKTMVHELGHRLGISASRTEDNSHHVTGFSGSLNTYTRLLVDSRGTKAQGGQQFDDPDAADFFDAYDGDVFFTGSTAQQIYHGNYVPVETSNELSGTFLTHLATGNGIMDFASWSSDRTFFSEVELAVLKDIGNDIDLGKHFGYSEYRDGASIKISEEFIGSDKSTRFSSGTWSSDEILAVGVHLAGVYERVGNAYNATNSTGNTLSLDANISVTGEGGTGIRIENNKNTVTIENARTVSANGIDGVGVLVTRGTDSTVTNNGTIEANGEGGRGVWFNNSATRGTLVNNGAIEAQQGEGVLFSAQGTLQNYGTIDSVVHAAGIRENVENSNGGSIGRIDVNNGGAVTNTGSAKIDSMNLSNGTVNNRISASIGSLTQSGGTVENTNIASITSVTQSGGTVNNATSATIDTISMNKGNTGTVNNGGTISNLTYTEGTYVNQYEGGTGTIGTLEVAGNITGIEWGTVDNLVFSDNGSGIISISAMLNTPALETFSAFQEPSVNSLGGWTFDVGIDVQQNIDFANGNIILDLNGVTGMTKDELFVSLFSGGLSFGDIFDANIENIDDLQTLGWGYLDENGVTQTVSIIYDGSFISEDWVFNNDGVLMSRNLTEVPGNTGNDTPEPTTLVIVGLGLFGLGIARRRRV